MKAESEAIPILVNNDKSYYLLKLKLGNLFCISI